MELIRAKFSDLISRISKTISHRIADELFANHFFTMDELNEVNSEQVSHKAARRLITGIMCKGEESCQHFLMFLEKQDECLYRDMFGKTPMGSVTEEDLEYLENHLKYFYQHPSFQTFHPLGKDTGIDILFNLETTFTDPLLWKKDTLNQRKMQMTLEDVLNKLQSPCIIEGEAGKGKTTILRRIAVLWSSGICQALQEYKLVFFITLRNTSEELYETLCDQLFPVTYDWKKEAFMHKIWKLGQKVLFLLDGYDEFNSASCPEIDDLIKQNYKYGSTVILTTRTESLGEVRYCGSQIVETSDFTVESAKTLITNVLREEEAAGLLLQLDETDFMKNLIKTPLFLVIACVLRMGESDFQMNTETALFCTLYDLMIERGQNQFKNIQANIIEENIRFCGDLALKGLFEHKYEFRREHLTNIKEDILLKIGLLNKYGAQQKNPGYRFFHTSFQEYIAGRRLSQLLSSEESSDMRTAECYINKIQTVYDVTGKYKNMLLYTCGSSQTATRKVLHHIRSMYKEEMNDYSCEFVEFGINLFYESATKTELSHDFKSLFTGKILHISMYNIASHHFDFFEYLPSCLSALNLVKLDLFGTQSNKLTEGEDEDKSPANVQLSKSKTYISEKVVKLFFDWTQALQTLEVTLKNFDQLNKYDIKCLGKICCCAERLRLNISCSKGITGTLTSVVENCKRMQDLIIENTPLSAEDERRIVDMTNMKILSLSNTEIQQQPGCLLDGLCNLVEIEKFVLHKISMNENDVELLAKGICCLHELKILKLCDLRNVGKGMEHVVESVSHNCHQIKELSLVNCYLTTEALSSLSVNLEKLTNLQILDLSDNYLEDGGKQSVKELGHALSHLPELSALSLPGGTDVKCCLDDLMCQLKKIPKLSKLAFRRWNMADEDMIKLGTYFKEEFIKLAFLDLSYNHAGVAGWISFINALQNLKSLKHFNLSTETIFIPIGDVVQTLCRVVEQLPFLSSLELNNWELDNMDLGKMKNVKLNCTTGESYEHFFQVQKT
ncbi:NLR family CARD domain-containing protein 4 [Pseudophryne corroboree]|uniref:NLR family CARD domain-containing protein 4 n=1 Tax=Pseudophryne corroboree TaxID=495146 RepID=UPI003081FE46